MGERGSKGTSAKARLVPRRCVPAVVPKPLQTGFKGGRMSHFSVQP